MHQARTQRKVSADRIVVFGVKILLRPHGVVALHIIFSVNAEESAERGGREVLDHGTSLIGAGLLAKHAQHWGAFFAMTVEQFVLSFFFFICDDFVTLCDLGTTFRK